MFGPLSFENTKRKSLPHEQPTKCFLCPIEFNLKKDLALFGIHIFEKHNVVIEGIQTIDRLHEYINYWGDKFRQNNIEEIIPIVDTNDNKYFFLSSLLKEDKELRHKLRLEAAMEVQEFERTDSSYTRQCLFCKHCFEGTRPDFLRHLSEQHNLQLGNPQNLVYIDELVEKIAGKMLEMKCIFCEKVFPERNVLKEHMRKKLHKRINPANKEYDRFYIVNYLEVDKTWEQIQSENDRIAVPRGYEQNTDEEYQDWEEAGDEITCLFCDKKEGNINTLCLHMDGDHDFDFVDCTKNLDFYQKIKLVNYIRRQIHDKKCVFCDLLTDKVTEHMQDEGHCKIPPLKTFDQPEFYFPTYENDAFLYYIDDVED